MPDRTKDEPTPKRDTVRRESQAARRADLADVIAQWPARGTDPHAAHRHRAHTRHGDNDDTVVCAARG
jgi:hypothetical protein